MGFLKMAKHKAAMATIAAVVMMFTTSLEAAEKVTVGVSPTTSTGGVFVALEKGFFKDEGLDVELQVFSSSTAPMLPLLAKGDLDVGGGVLTASLFDTSAGGVGLWLVADKGSVQKDADYLKLMVRTDLVASGRYKTYSDLKGFKVGVPSLGGTSQEAAMALFLKKGGLRASDVEYVKAGYSDAAKLFQAKAIDAYIHLEPYVADLVKSKTAVVIEGLYAIHPEQQSAAIFYSPKFAEKRRDVGVKFMKAYIRGCRAYNAAFLSDRKAAEFRELVGILTKWTSIKDEAVYANMIPAGLRDDASLNMKSLKDDVDYYVSRKYLKAAPDFSKIVDLEFVEKAKAMLEPGKKAEKTKKKLS